MNSPDSAPVGQIVAAVSPIVRSISANIAFCCANTVEAASVMRDIKATTKNVMGERLVGGVMKRSIRSGN